MDRIKPKVDFTEGPMFWRIFLFALPIMLTGMLQIFYNMADHIVVGNFSGDDLALAAVGSTASFTNLIISLLMGIAAGASVTIAQFYGAKNDGAVSRAVHTSMTFSAIGGVFVCIFGILIARPALALIGINADILDRAVLYFQIVAIGFPALSVYNFGASVFRAIGDSKTPLLILSLSGIVNVLLNLLFVIAFNMTVDGVAIATVISQYVSAVWIVAALAKRRGECYGFSFSKISIDGRILLRILRFGIPTGIQSSLFSLSNVVITGAVNTFPTATITAKTIEGNIDGITYTSMNCFLHAAMTFTGQNYGANKVDRVKKTLIYCLIQVAVVGIAVSQLELLFAESLCSMFVDTSMAGVDVIIKEAVNMMYIIMPLYFLCGFMEVFSGTLRGLGYSVFPMLISLGGACLSRIVWVSFIFPLPEFNSVWGLFIIYPISWAATAAVLMVLLVCVLIRLSKKEKSRDNPLIN